jgi:outer membrane lipoprotein-sorting protein
MMQRARKIVLVALVALLMMVSRAGLAAPADSKDEVLRKLDAAAAGFHSAAAVFQFDSYQTDPIPDTDVQKGTVYYLRDAKGFKMAAHIREVNGKPVPKVFIFSGGILRLYEEKIDKLTTLSKLSQYESWFMLGFGASGKDLEEKFDIKYLGSEILDGVKTEKLELVPKDTAVRKNIPKVTVWMDTERGVSLKQLIDEGPGQYRVSVYFNIRINQPLPADAFTFKTDSQTQFIDR